MANYIVNAAPNVVNYGTEDNSARQQPRPQIPLPQHVPKYYIFAQKGDSTEQLVVGTELTRIYGSDTFDLRKKYANHATAFVLGTNSQGNAMMVKRVIPNDAGPLSNVCVYLDVLPTTVNVYARNTDGSIKLDGSGNPVVDTTATGSKVKFVVKSFNNATDAQNFGARTIEPGDQSDTVSGVQSQRYPIMEFKASSIGEDGNNTGIRIWAPTTINTVQLPITLMKSEKVYPFNFQVMRRSTSGTASAVSTLMGDRSVTSVFKPMVIDPTTDLELYIGDNFVQAYQNLTDPKYAPVAGDVGTMHVYQNNIDTLLTTFHANESAFLDSYSDFTTDVSDMYLFNFISGTNTSGMPYRTYQFVNDTNGVRFNEYSTVFLNGGSDGTMNDAVFADLVAQELTRYGDANDDLMEDAINVESVFYDSGFPLATKFAACNFISNRKDTAVVLSTYTVGEPDLSAAEEQSLATVLRTRLQMYPESDYFGTQTARGVIVGRSAKVSNSPFKGRLPLTYEWMMKTAAYMGASDGKWKSNKNFDGAPGSILTYMEDVSIKTVPAQVRNKHWDVGLNWVQPYDRGGYFFPAFKTVYPDDTSVLNSWMVICAICTINKITKACWRDFSGKELPDPILIQRVNAYVTNNTNGKFDGRFIIQPQAVITDGDAVRGFSWTLPVKLFAPNMKSVMTTYVQAYRLSDYKA